MIVRENVRKRVFIALLLFGINIFLTKDILLSVITSLRVFSGNSANGYVACVKRVKLRISRHKIDPSVRTQTSEIDL